MDKSVTSVVIKGLAEHKETLGAPLCPCRHYDDKEAEAKMGYWNCPCTPMRERKVRHAQFTDLPIHVLSVWHGEHFVVCRSAIACFS